MVLLSLSGRCPRLVYAVGFFSISISDKPEVIGDCGDIKPKDVQQAVLFVKENKDLLLAIWEMDVYPDEANYKKVA